MVYRRSERYAVAGIVLVRDVMSKDVKVVRPDTLVKEVVATMNKFDIGSIVVVQSNRPVGIITKSDILRRIVEPCLAPEILRAREVMSSPVTTINETSSIDEAAKIMANKRIKRLLVMDNENLVGMLTFTDIVTQMPNMLGILEELVRPHHRSY
ncbi:MAG: cyclic nucleotide-binding/CBS domain-containing protein [Candidatus Bathyarchaeia archaeon]